MSKYLPPPRKDTMKYKPIKGTGQPVTLDLNWKAMPWVRFMTGVTHEPIKGTGKPYNDFGLKLGGGPSEIARFLKEVLPVLMASPAPPTKTQKAKKTRKPKTSSKPTVKFIPYC
jgi:hypothetical protein